MKKDLISEWHNLSKFQITQEVLTKRCEALEEILARNEISYWVDIVRIFLELNPEEKNITHFVSAFQTKDDSFPRLRIEKLIKALAGMALATKILEAIEEITGEKITEEQNEEEEQSSSLEVANVICIALINSIFLKQFKIETKIPLIQVANDFLSKFSSQNRIINLDEHKTALIEIEQRLINEEEEITSEVDLSVIRAAQAIMKSNNIQKEELNILWWIFGEFSEIGGEYFANIDKKAMSIIAARELHNLSQFKSELPACKHLLRKILSLSNSDKSLATAFSIKECIEALDLEMRKKIIGIYKESVDELTPCMNVLLKYEGNEGLKNIKVDINEKVDLSILSLQFYKELTFLSAI
jgi:hypothetical protein